MNDADLGDIIEHYGRDREAERLSSGPGVLERIRTEEIVSRHLPPAPCRVLDIGGGPGTYALWLLRRGYTVELIDLVPGHVEKAAKLFEEFAPRGSARVGDARRLDAADGSFDTVLLLGPMYHLTERSDRLLALGEVRRVLRPGGFAFIAAISRFASLLDGFSRRLVRDPDFVTILDRDLRDGRHRNATGKEYFTTAYFHHPDELPGEIADAGLALRGVHAVEGPFWFMSGFAELFDDPETRQLMLDFLRRVESEPSMLGASAHWLAVAERTG
jgi:SAM-dependent methyltransferase